MEFDDIEVTNRGTRYRLKVFTGYFRWILAETGWGPGYGEWIQLDSDSVAWSYIREKMPKLAERDGDRAGWVKAFSEAGVEIFGWEPVE